jgi:plasmid replication initiation protein
MKHVEINEETARARVLERLAQQEVARMEAEQAAKEAAKRAADEQRARKEEAAKLLEQENSIRAEIENVGKVNALQVKALFDGFRTLETLVGDAERLAAQRRSLLGEASQSRDALFPERLAFAKAARKAIIRDTLYDFDRLGLWLDPRLIMSAR